MKKLLCIIAPVFMALCALTGCGNGSPAGKVEELEGLKGRVVYSIGRGNVPDLVFRYILKKAGVDYRFADTAKEGTVSLAYVSEGTEFIAGLTTGQMNYGVVSEPAATAALKKVESAERMLDIQELYANATGSENGYPQAALVVKKSFLAAHSGYVADFLSAFKAGAKWAESEPVSALSAIKSKGSTAVAMLTAEIAKGCNLGFTSANSAKKQLLGFYEALDSVKEDGETPIGNKTPDDAFFADADKISGESETGVTAKVYAPDGAPAISLAKLIADEFSGAEFNIVQPANIGGFVGNGTADIAIMPTNAAANMHAQMLKKGDDDIVMLGVTNWGSLYLIGRN